jgi:hypothetical protein
MLLHHMYSIRVLLPPEQAHMSVQTASHSSALELELGMLTAQAKKHSTRRNLLISIDAIKHSAQLLQSTPRVSLACTFEHWLGQNKLMPAQHTP